VSDKTSYEQIVKLLRFSEVASFEYHHFNSSYKADCSVYWSSRDGNNFVIEFSYKYHAVLGLGIETSAVKHISGKHKENDLSSVSTMVSTVKNWSWLPVFFGALLAIFFSSWLSTITFGNTDYTLAFIFISVTVSKTISFRSISGL
jgi:hypothetical protein